MKLSMMKVLSAGEIKSIHEATLDILSNCGVKIGSPKMFEFLKERGLPMDNERQIVRFPRACIENALAHIPDKFEVFNREGQHVFTLGDGVPRVAAGHNAVFWVDSKNGATRPSTIADVELFSRLCDQLSAIDMIGIPVMPQDVPDPRASLLYGLKAVIANSRKPVYFSTDKMDINRACIQMLRTAFAGKLESQVYGISQLSPTSPLYWEGDVLEALKDTVNTGVPLAILPEPNAGVSAPYTLAGLLTMNNAECLSGLVMAQLVKPGAKVMYANSWTTTDMRTGAALVGSVETSVCRVAGAQLAHFYHVPSHTTAPNSDNHAHDEQNAWEKTFSLLAALAAGNDLIVNCGMFATGMTCSHEQLLMDAEMAAMARRFAQGLDVHKETIAAELIQQIGPLGETYLIQPHTLERIRSREYFVPDLAIRGPLAVWQAAGARDTYALSRARVEELRKHTGGALSSERQQQLHEILARCL